MFYETMAYHGLYMAANYEWWKQEIKSRLQAAVRSNITSNNDRHA
jgi:hypothetical protein